MNNKMTFKPSASISAITFSGGQDFVFRSCEKVILVGPNNSGKSQTLREILQIATSGNLARPVVVRRVNFEKTGSAEELKSFLDQNAEYFNGSYRYKSWAINERHTQFWVQPYLQHGLASGYIKNIDANDRLKICQQ